MAFDCSVKAALLGSAGVSAVGRAIGLVLLGITFTAGLVPSAAVAQTGFNEFTMEIIGANCSTRPDDSAECRLPGNSPFTVAIMLDRIALPDLDQDNVGGYLGLQLNATNDPELTQIDSPQQSEIVWPDCGFPVESRSDTSVTIGCATDVLASSSTYIGVIALLSYRCGPSGSGGRVTLVHGVGLGTMLVDELAGEHANDSSGSTETLEVTCLAGTPWTPLPSPTVAPRSTFLEPTPEPDSSSPSADQDGSPQPVGTDAPAVRQSDGDGGDGSRRSLWIGIGVVVALGVTVLGVAGAWFIRRSGGKTG